MSGIPQVDDDGDRCAQCRWFNGTASKRADYGECLIPSDLLPVWVRPSLNRSVYRMESCGMWEQAPQDV